MLNAEHTQIYMSLSNLPHCNENLNSHFSDIKLWMCGRKLKLNEGKTEFLFINGSLRCNLDNFVKYFELCDEADIVQSVRNLVLCLIAAFHLFRTSTIS